MTSLGLSCLSLVLTVHDVKELKNAVPLPEPIVSAIKEGKISKSEIKERFAPEIEKIEAELLAKSSELREKFTALCKDAKIKGVRIKIDGMNVDQCATLLANEP
ncbi:MAG TPA: hypothetical protein DEA55_06160 [Rhodospirillaceae bacterium]|nr:hypothetical protein [Rhodospirillaceae bacterium]